MLLLRKLTNSLACLVAFLRGYWRGKRSARLTRTAIQRIQRQGFRRLVKRVLSRSPYYRVVAAYSLTQFPVIDKAQMLASFDQINTVGLSLAACERQAQAAESSGVVPPLGAQGDVAAGFSSGTSGRRGIFITRPQERAEWAGYIIAKNLPWRWRPQKVALVLRANNALYQSSQGYFIRFRFFDLRQPLTALAAALVDFLPDVLIAPAQVLGALADTGIAIAPHKIISVAEVLEPDVKARVTQHFNVPVSEIYQCTEGYLASTCALGRLHLNEDIAIIERQWLDEDSGRFVPIITDLRRRSQPMVRFRLDDILVASTQPCECGSAMAVIEKIEGRCDDSLWLPDRAGLWRPVFPDVVRRAMWSCGLSQYRIEQRGAVWQVCYSSNQPTQAVQRVRQHLADLADRLELKLPQLEFSPLGVHDCQQKHRRLACVRRPAPAIELLQPLGEGIACTSSMQSRSDQTQ